MHGDDCDCWSCNAGKEPEMNKAVKSLKEEREAYETLGGLVLYSSVDVGGGLMFKTEETYGWYTIKRIDVNKYTLEGGRCQGVVAFAAPREGSRLEAGMKVDFTHESKVFSETVVAIQRIGVGKWDMWRP